MWSSTNQRIKALMSARQREKERLTRPIYVRRTDLVLSFSADDGVLVEIAARALLNDLTPEGFCIYAATSLNSNVEISLQIDHPKRFKLKAKVLWSQYQASSSHVITTQNFPYRMKLSLLWKDSTQEEEFKTFCSVLDELYVSKEGLFIEEAFVSDSPVTVEAAQTMATEAPAPTEEASAPVEMTADSAVPAPEPATEVLETVAEIEKKAA